MPELPEVETCVRLIAPALENREVKALQFYVEKLRYPTPIELALFRPYAKVRSVNRHHKNIVINMEDPTRSIVIHLGMSGTFHILDKKKPSKFTTASSKKA